MGPTGDGSGKRRILSDRAVLKLLLWLVAGLLLAVGVSSMASGAEMRYVTEDAVYGPATCGATTSTVSEHNGTGSASPVGGPCIRTRLQPEQTSLTQAGWTRMVGGGSAVALAVVLLFYQALRWPPDKVGPWLPRQAATPPPPAVTGAATSGPESPEPPQPPSN